MIIKGQARGRASQLAKHLLSTDQNETVRLFECRGTVSDDVASALAEIEAHGEVAASKRPLYHASISPARHAPLTDEQVRIAADILEKKLGFSNQPRVIVLHRKAGRDHVHVVWSRIDVENGRAIPDAWNYRHHEKVARELEALFGHQPVRKSSARRGRGGRAVKDYELRQAERSGRSPRKITHDISALWRASRDGMEFRRRLAEAGYTLARGDRRVFVVVDQAGEAHSLARRIEGADTRAVQEFLFDVELAKLPSVSDARQTIRKDRKQIAIRSKFVAAGKEVSLRWTRPAWRFLPSSYEAIAFAEAERPTSSAHYRSFRAIIIASFAARIADAIRAIPKSELASALEALRRERAAALGRDENVQVPQVRIKRKRRSESRQCVFGIPKVVPRLSAGMNVRCRAKALKWTD